MSRKNNREEKKIRKLERVLRKGRVPTYLNLEQWLVDYHYAKSKTAARKLLFEHKVKYESHVLGFADVIDKNGDSKEVYSPLVSAAMRPGLTVEL